MLERLFKLHQHRTSFKVECMAGLSSFATASYLLLVAPLILSHAHIHYEYAYYTTCAILAIGCIIMAFVANFPAIVGPGLGLLTYFSYVVTHQMHVPMAQSFSAIFIAGVLMAVFTVSNLRQRFLQAIPPSLGCAIAGGIGFFIAFVALKNAHLIVGNNDTLVQLGNLATYKKALFFIGFFSTAFLSHQGYKTAILLGIVITTLLYYLAGLSPDPSVNTLAHAGSRPWLSLDWSHINLHWVSIAFTFFIIALFDSTGTLLGLCHQIDNQSMVNDPRFKKALMSESICAVIAPLVGMTTPCPLVESATGISAGGRTGLTALCAALLFIAAIGLVHLATLIPNCATAAALFYTACLMLRPIANINWKEPNDYIPAVITLLMIPLTFSITNGVGLGIICYVVLNCFDKNWRKIHPLIWAFSFVFLLYFLS